MMSASSVRGPSWSAVRTGVFVAVVAALVAGCATKPTAYRASDPQSRHGYAEEQLGPNRFRVRFSGNSQTEREVVEDYLLYRAAEVTLSKGFTHFVFVNQDTEAKTYYRDTFDDWPRTGFYWHTWPWGYGSGFGASLSTSTSRPITSYTAYADVVLLSLGEAKSEPAAFDARDVLEAIGPRIRTLPQS